MELPNEAALNNFIPDTAILEGEFDCQKQYKDSFYRPQLTLHPVYGYNITWSSLSLTVYVIKLLYRTHGSVGTYTVFAEVLNYGWCSHVQYV